MFAQLRRVDGLDAVACNWEAACSNSGGSGTELLPACIAVKTSPEHEAPDLSAVAVGAVAAFTQGPCSDALEFQIHLKERLATHIAVVASCEICELFLQGEYAASARGQVHAPLLKHPQAAVGSQQDLEAMRLFLFDCSDGASVSSSSSSSSSSKIMLRLRRSTSALAPDVSLGVISIFCSVAAPRLPAPVMDVDKVRALLSQLQQQQPTSSSPVIVHPQAHNLLENMQAQAAMRSAIGKQPSIDHPTAAISPHASTLPSPSTSELPSHRPVDDSVVLAAVRAAVREEVAAAFAASTSALVQDLQSTIKTAVREAIREEIGPMLSSAAAATAAAAQQLGERVAAAVDAAVERLRVPAAGAAVAAASS